MKINEGWDYKLWTKQNIHELDFNWDLFDSLLEKRWFTALKDYAQIVALKQFGGVFMDLDFVCEKPFDELAYRFSYFSSLEPNYIWSMVP